jgi:hypothetical protein
MGDLDVALLEEIERTRLLIDRLEDEPASGKRDAALAILREEQGRAIRALCSADVAPNPS